jgi:lipopolysaccharide/colanic/teichoic acid biosynthesis glycosyltransferase
MLKARVVSSERPVSRHDARGPLPHRRRWRWLKRPFDALIAGVGLLDSAPLWALIALGITLDDGGPVFYGQTRVGQGGRPFKSWKFRSMIPESDQRFGPPRCAAYAVGLECADHRLNHREVGPARR